MTAITATKHPLQRVGSDEEVLRLGTWGRVCK